MHRRPLPGSICPSKKILGVVVRAGLCLALGACSHGGMNPPAEGSDMAVPPDGGAQALTAVQPAHASTAGGVTVTLSGSGFAPGVSVTFDGTAASDLHFVSSHELTAVVPPRPGAFGKVAVAVQNPDGKRVARSDLFSYVPATFAFAQRVDYATQARPLFIEAADLNGDHQADLLLDNSNSDSLSLLAGNGDGSFAPQRTFPTDAAPHGMRVVDLDGDAKLDAVVACHTSNLLNVFLGTGDGGLTKQTGSDLRTGMGPIFLSTGDLNQDGKVDLVVSNFNAKQATVHMGQGGGKFAAQVALPTGDYPFGSVIADLNEDGILDYAVVDRSINTLSVFLGKGDGSFQPRADYLTIESPIGLTVGDVNGDGHPDLLAASSLTPMTPPKHSLLAVHRGSGDGTFNGHIDFESGSGPRMLALHDLNADGALDIVVANFDSDSITVLLGKGDGTFPSRFDYQTGSLPHGVAIGNFNGDQKPDLAITNSGSDSVSIFLNTSQ